MTGANGEHGQGLSQGQLQCLVIARTVCSGATGRAGAGMSD